jgi:hypothetical protein
MIMYPGTVLCYLSASGLKLSNSGVYMGDKLDCKEEQNLKMFEKDNM